MMFRVSEVESFRAWREDADADLEPLLARLRGEDAPSEARAAGTAFHKALELAPYGSTDTLEALGYRFTIPADVEIDIPEIRELRASKTYVVDGLPITISGQVDALHGLRVDDHKTTGYFTPDRYFDGYQWRLYLEIFGAQKFRWNIFTINEVEPKTYEVRDFHALEQYRYPSMPQDCEQLVTDFARFARAYLPERAI